MSLKEALTKQYSFSDVTALLRPEKLFKRARLRFVPMRGGFSVLSGEQKVVPVPVRTLSLSSFSFPFGRKVPVRNALELRFRPILGAGESNLSLIPQITRQKANETAGIAWFVSKQETEELEKRFEDCVLWPAPYLFSARVNGNGVVVCEYEDCCCGMLFADGEPQFYQWQPACSDGSGELSAQLLEYGRKLFPDKEFDSCTVRPEEEQSLQQTGDALLAESPSAALLNLSSSTVSAGEESEKLMAKIAGYADLATMLGAVFLVLSLALAGIGFAGHGKFAEAPSEIYRTVLGENSANPVSSVMQKLRLVSSDTTDLSFENSYSRIASAWETLSVRPKIDELRYSASVIQLSGSAAEAQTIDAFRKALADNGFTAATDSVQQVQKIGMRFTISLTERKKK